MSAHALSNQPATESTRPAFDAARARRDFPVLHQKVHGRPLVFLDSAASAQKPRAVIDEVQRFYMEDYANIHRGVYELSVRATRAFEAARDRIRDFINAESSKQVIFTSGTTAAINLVAQSYGRTHVAAGDSVLVTGMEHHSNIVPWQMLCNEKGAKLDVAPIDDDGALNLDALEQLLGPRTRLLAIAHQSNALGTINPIARIVEMAHAKGVPVLVDGAQAVPHQPVDVQQLGVDFYAFSGHKLYGPSGIGVLYGREELLEAMPPWQGGGEMIRSVRFEGTTYADLPAKLEAGTPNIAGAVGLGAAIAYVEELGLDAIAAYEHDLLTYAIERLSTIPSLRLVGTAAEKSGVVSFVLGDAHAHDVGTILDHEAIAVRTGHHCAQPVMERFGVAATVRASLGLYNVREDIDALVVGLEKVREVFS